MTKSTPRTNATQRISTSKQDPGHSLITQPNTTHPTEPARRALGRAQLKATKPFSAPEAAIAPHSMDGLSSYSRQIRINIHLFDTIQNAVSSAISGGNYRYGSAADFIRESLKDYSVNKQLLLDTEKGNRKLMSLRLDEGLKNFWDSLPIRQRPNILERAIRTKLLNLNLTQPVAR